MLLKGVLTAFIMIYITGVQSVKEITSLDVDVRKYRDLGTERQVGFAVGNIKIKLCSPVAASKPEPLIILEIYQLNGDKPMDHIIMTKESFDFKSDDEDDHSTLEGINIANLVLIPQIYPLRATFKVDKRYKGADCVQRTYTDQKGAPLAKFDEELLTQCPF